MTERKPKYDTFEPTAAKLLRAATAVFSERGFAGARVDEIARRAGANKAMIYYHFGTKRALYDATFARQFDSMDEALRQVAARRLPPEERLPAIIASMAQRFEDEPALPRLVLHEMLSEGRHVSPVTARKVGGIFKLVRATLEEGMAAGVFRRVEPFLVHLTLIGSLLFFFASNPFRHRLQPAAAPDVPLPPSSAFLAHLNDFMTRGLLRAKKEGVRA